MGVVGSQYRSNRAYHACIPKKASIDSQAGNFADDGLPGLSVCIFVKRYLSYLRALREYDNAAQVNMQVKVDAIELCATRQRCLDLHIHP